MPDKYIIQRRMASGLENVAELPALENGKIDLSWLPVVGSMGSAIIERGSNANGEYIRWADGTQVCMKKLSGLGPVTQSSGSGDYNSDNIQIGAWPASFISPPYCAYLSTESAAYVPSWIRTKNAPTETRGSQINIVCAMAYDITTFSVSALAIGRWK